jgi:methionyl-tRNA formyltransferase
MSGIKVIILCSSRFALPAMQELMFFQQLAAVAIPDHCEEMIEQTEAVLEDRGIPVLRLEKENFVRQLSEAIDLYEINLGLMMTFSFKLPASIYTLPSKGFFNVHPGPLPFYRGADPVFQQIRNREKQAGVTIHKVDESFDTGPLVMQEMIHLEVTDTYGILTTKLSVVAARLVVVLIKMIGFGTLIPGKPQNETRSVYYKKQTAKDIAINWQTMNADEIIALINACNPWNKGAVAKIQNSIIRLLLAEKKDPGINNKEPAGTILSFDNGIMTVATIHNEAISVNMIFMDEGFLKAEQLCYKGISVGMRFEEIR